MSLQALRPLSAFQPFRAPLGGVNALAALIKALFGNDEQGGLWLPGPTTCFTDVEGTTAAVEDDVVRRISDLSGNGNHFTQADVDKAPQLKKTVGGFWYLSFDGVDEGMETSNTLGTLLNSADYIFSGIAYTNNDTTGGYIFHSQGGITTQANIAFAYLCNASSVEDRWVFRTVDNDTTSSLNNRVTIANIDKAADPRTGIVRWEGIETSAVVGGPAAATQPLTLGYRSPVNPAVHWNGKFFGAAISLQYADAAKVLQLEQFLARHTEVTLP